MLMVLVMKITLLMFGFTRSKVKVSRVTFVNKSYPFNTLRFIYQTAFIFYTLTVPGMNVY